MKAKGKSSSAEVTAARQMAALRSAWIVFLVGYPLLLLGESYLDRKGVNNFWVYALVGLVSASAGIATAELYSRLKKRKVARLGSSAARPKRRDRVFSGNGQDAQNWDLLHLVLSRERHWIFSGNRPRLSALLLSLDSISTYIILLGGTAYLLFDPDLSRLAGWPATLIGGGFGACVIIRLSWLVLLVRHFKNLHADDELVIASALGFFAADILSATCMIVGCLYYFGVVDAFSSFMSAKLPSLNPRITSFISQALSWLVSAATSGIAWDIMKRIASALRRRSSSEESSARPTKGLNRTPDGAA